MRMKIGDCYDVTRSADTVKFYIYTTLRARFDHKGKFLVREGSEPGTARIWRVA
jgi:hypothetical protein